MEEDNQQTFWDSIAEKMLLEFAKYGCPIFRATTPLSWGKLKGLEVNSKAKDMENCRFTLTVQETIETAFRIISEYQLILHGTVVKMCEEYESLHERTVQPVVMGQSIVLNAIKTESSLENDDPAYQHFPTCEERIEAVHNKKKWVNSAWMQNFWVFWRMDSITWRKTLEI